jgi:hypothetical protein
MLRSKFSFLLSLAVPFAVAVVPVLGSSTALADATPPAARVALPRTTVTASFQRYLLAPGGRPMGMMLSDGTFVGLPGRSLHKDAPVLNAGDKIDIEGVAMLTPTGTVIHRAIIRQGGNVIADATQVRRHRHHDGQAREDHARKHEGRHHAVLTPQTAAGKVAAIVSGPRGRVAAVLLSDGTTATGHGLQTLGLKVGDKVSVAGQGGVYTQGKALRIEKITLPSGEIRDLPRRAPRAPEPSQTPA